MPTGSGGEGQLPGGRLLLVFPHGEKQAGSSLGYLFKGIDLIQDLITSRRPT